MPQQNLTYLIQIVADTAQGKAVVRSFDRIDRSAKRVQTRLPRATRRTNDFIKALRRVAIVVPVWFAFRRAMMATFATIQSGIQHWIELESAIARAQAVTTDATINIGTSMGRIRALAEQFALTHKGTAKDVVEAYFRMATSGLNFAESLEGAVPAVKLAIGTYGDVATTAKTVSAIFRLLGDRIEGVNTDGEKMARVADVLARAWQDNEFEMNEMAQAIANVGGQAKAFGLTMEQTIAVLATSSDALIKSGRAGRLFGLTLDDMVKNLDEVEQILGRTFDPAQPLNFFEILMDLIRTFRDAGRTTKEIEDALAGVFGRRARRQFRSIVALSETLDRNLETLATSADGAVDALLRLRDATPEAQLENFRENLAFLIAEFIRGAVGTDDFVTAMEQINRNLQDMSLSAGILGAQLTAIIQNLKAVFRLGAVLPKAFGTRLGELISGLGREGVPGVFETITKGLAEAVTGVQLPRETALEEFFSPEGFLKSIEDAYNEAVDVIVDPVERMNKVVENHFEVWQDNMKRIDTIRRKQIEQAIGETGIDSKRIDRAKLLVKHQLTLLKLRGATTRQLLEAEIALKEAFDIENTQVKQLERRLKLEQEITKEKLGQVELSEESVQLFKIARRFGGQTAEAISLALRGGIAPLELGRRERRVFQQFFPGRFEQEEARRFFFEGAGRGLAIPERETFRRFQEAPTLAIPIQTRTEININIDSQRIIDRIKEAINRDLDKAESPLSRRINEKIDEF